MLAFDTAGWIDLAACKAAGAGAVGLYLNGNLTAAYAKQAAEIDIGIWSFWERFASDPNGGEHQGRLDAGAAVARADAVHQPEHSAIYLPNDEMVTDWSATIDYFGAAEPVIRASGRVPGFYGQSSVYAQLSGYPYFCHAPDGTEGPFPDAAIVQGTGPQRDIGGVTCDTDELQHSNYGGWHAGGTLDHPSPRKVAVEAAFVTAGSRSEAVRVIQVALGLSGSGHADEETVKAWRTFQSDRRITPADFFGKESWDALIGR